MTWTRGRGRFLIAALAVGVAMSACMQIETGQTSEEATSVSADRGHAIRAEWANRLAAASPVQMVDLEVELYGQVVESYLRYGRAVVDDWHEGNEGRGVEIPAEEMIDVVAASTATERPILDAWEENLEYGRARIVETAHFDDDLITTLDDLLAVYYEVYSAAMFPAGNVVDYESRLREMSLESDRVTELMADEIRRYR